MPFLLLAYGALRLVKGPPLGTQMWPAIGLSVLWIAAVLVTVFSHRYREWLVLRRKQLALCFVTTLISLGLFDLGLTLTGVVPTIDSVRRRSLEYRPSVSTVHRLVPKTVFRDDGPPVTVNHRGFRGPEIVIPKPADTCRIIFFGGSHVFDFDGNNWPKLVEDSLLRMGKKVDVVNAGVPGHRTADSLGKLLTDLWLLEPDVVVVCHAWNDIKYFSTLEPNVAYRDWINPPGRDWRIHPYGIDWLCGWSALYRTGRGRLIQMLIGEEGSNLRPPTGKIGSLGIRQFKLNLQSTCDIADNLGADVVLCKQARLPTKESSDSDKKRIKYGYVGLPHDELVRAFAECDRVVDEVAREKQCRTIDMNEPLSGRSELFKDHIHFSPKGSQSAAETVATELYEIIK